jgi:predicted O-methyltransferase YrrM
MMMSMSSSLSSPKIARLLEALHAEAHRIDPPLLAAANSRPPKERAAMLDEAFIPVDTDAGHFLYALVRGASAGNVVEFGTSFGISTIYLAAAVRDRGNGSVITTELLASKARTAAGYFAQAGLADRIDLRVGDALETLRDVKDNVGVLFLDGWKNLYLPILQLLEPALRPGSLVVADDLDLFPEPLKPYLAYVRDPAHGYVSVKVPIGDAMELSVRT